MRTYKPLAEKVADRTGVQLQLPSDALYLGVDANGAEHYHSRIADTVVVLDPAGTVERREELDGRPLSDWIDYVENNRGWKKLNYADSLAEIITDALEVA